MLAFEMEKWSTSEDLNIWKVWGDMSFKTQGLERKKTQKLMADLCGLHATGSRDLDPEL